MPRRRPSSATVSSQCERSPQWTSASSRPTTSASRARIADAVRSRSYTSSVPAPAWMLYVATRAVTGDVGGTTAPPDAPDAPDVVAPVVVAPVVVAPAGPAARAVAARAATTSAVPKVGRVPRPGRIRRVVTTGTERTSVGEAVAERVERRRGVALGGDVDGQLRRRRDLA